MFWHMTQGTWWGSLWHLGWQHVFKHFCISHNRWSWCRAGMSLMACMLSWGFAQNSRSFFRLFENKVFLSLKENNECAFIHWVVL
jgi:hypothetical protein